jgi:hypothetical protein
VIRPAGSQGDRRRAGALPTLAALAALTLATAVAGCSSGSASGPVTPGSGPHGATTSPPTPASSPAAAGAHHRLTAGQRRAVHHWYAAVGRARLAPVAAQQRAVLAALDRHDRYGAFDHCQPEQEAVELAQEARPVPVRRVNARWQAALAALAGATTHCLNGVGRGDHGDLRAARRAGRRALHQLVAVRRAIAR